MVQDDAGAEEVVVDADEMRQLRVQHHPDALFPQSKSFLLQTCGQRYDEIVKIQPQRQMCKKHQQRSLVSPQLLKSVHR